MRLKLKQARLAADMTQQQAARAIGITVRYYNYIESGARTGNTRIWDELETLFNIPQRTLREDTKSVAENGMN